MRFTEREMTLALQGAAKQVLAAKDKDVRKGRRTADEAWTALTQHQRYVLLDGLGTQVLPSFVALPDVAWRIGTALAVFAVLAGAFYLGMMGGGDVKLAAALALWFSPLTTLRFLVLMSAAGGVLTLVVVLAHRLRSREGKPEIPYGVAIAFGGLWIVAQRFLNQFA